MGVGEAAQAKVAAIAQALEGSGRGDGGKADQGPPVVTVLAGPNLAAPAMVGQGLGPQHLQAIPLEPQVKGQAIRR
jgi:hypothetical protein